MYHALLLLLSSAAQSPVRDSADYVVWNHGRRAGEMRIVMAGDSVSVNYFHIDRQRGPRVEGYYRLSAGRPVRGEIRSGGAQSAAADISGKPVPLSVAHFEVRDDAIRSWTDGDTTSLPAPGGAFFIPSTTTPFDDAVLAAFLLRQPQRTSPIVPAATARVEIAADTLVSAGGRDMRARLAVIHGIGFAPSLV